jgi:uncharacterized protein (TIGR03437 family)
VIAPNDSNTVYAATSEDGVYKSVDGGRNWARFNDGLTNLNIRALAIVPGAPATLYAATPTGVFKAVDDVLHPHGHLFVSSVRNAASGLTGPAAPGEIVVIFGFGLGPEQLITSVPGSDGLFGTELAGTTVQINGTPVQLIYTLATQVAAIVPDSVSAHTAQITVTYQGQTSDSFPVPIAPAAPGIFTQDSTGQGHAATINQNGSINTPAHWEGDVVTLFLTGIGQATSDVTIHGYNLPLIPISVDKGTVPGVMQIKVPILHGQDCDTPVVVQVGNASSQAGVTIAIDLCI